MQKFPFSLSLVTALVWWLNLSLPSGVSGADAPPPAAPPATWEGCERRDFTVDGRACLLVVPKEPAPGRPWIWRTEFFGAFPSVDIALLKQGWHIAYMDVQNLYGAPPAMAAMDKFYAHLTNQFHLAAKTVPEGFSRGGLFAFNWSVRNPQCVSSIYVDAPVCDFKSWPGGKFKGKGSPEDWARCQKAYGLSETEALAYRLNPVDNLEPLAKAKIPVIAVCGDADDLVPPAENINLIEERYPKLGGEIKVIHKPGVGHHPHSLENPKEVVDFLISHFRH